MRDAAHNNKYMYFTLRTSLHSTLKVQSTIHQTQILYKDNKTGTILSPLLLSINPPLPSAFCVKSDPSELSLFSSSFSCFCTNIMELQFQTPQIKASSITKLNKETTRTINKSKFLGVRQRPSGKWVAEIKNTTQKIRMWLGTFDTAEEAARAYDEAACLLRGSNTRTNFVDHIPPSSALSLKIKNLLHQKKSLRQKQKDPKEASVPISASATKVSSNSCSLSSPIDGSSNEGLLIFDNAYKPDLSNFSGGFDMSNPHSDRSSCYNEMNNTYDHEYLSHQEDEFKMEKSSSVNENEMIDFDRMKVERQRSASLYAINGMNEYWDNIHDYSSDVFWDLPLLCKS